jgi:hypothetical protein
MGIKVQNILSLFWWNFVIKRNLLKWKFASTFDGGIVNMIENQTLNFGVHTKFQNNELNSKQ